MLLVSVDVLVRGGAEGEKVIVASPVHTPFERANSR